MRLGPLPQRHAGGRSQNPPKQLPVQQSAGFAHRPLVGTHADGTPPPSGAGVTFGTQLPPVHWALQQSPAAAHTAPFAAQGVLHTPAMHEPLQQSAFAVHATPCAKHVAGPNPQRSVALSHVLQHPLPSPDVQLSPVGRQSRLA
jgi:hypothetical protein